MNHQDVPPKPGTPPTSGLPQVPAAQAPDHGRAHGHAPAQGPAPASVTWSQPRPQAERGPSRKLPATTRRTLWKALFAVVLLAVIAGLVWLALWLNSSPGSSGDDDGAAGVLETTAAPRATPLPLPRDGVQPADYALGDCFADFDPEALASRLVPCDTGHSAQLVAVFRYPESEDYPGAEALKAKALEACQAARLGPAANEYQLNYQRSFPSSTSWESGDRRVDCYVTASGGNVIKASVLP
ncbi:hypothetical protein FDW83_09770 [Pseudarthrobacter sp. NamE2]|uniref:septum formation family protein n=1 Tax=Pseudarthrobacter sp. NamE2 TaxID=2576838 RepID=UPI0010FD81D9|nr:septum formation family protein [Pseudarthrobacter sp. NamE2]TLM83252.1 hypothetical protein FDW83_09770 [Pseudarthrobacter sp. NamE2]